jgi:hypothetical protein
MSKIEVDAIDKQSGSTLTLGGSGTAVTLASGATQSGFGRTGTVDWDTTPKTATFTAVSGDGFFANTTGSSFNMNLPAGSAGDIVSVADYAGTWQNNSLTVVPNGTDKIGGVNANVTLSTEGQSVTFLFVDSTQGWVNIQDSTSNERGSAFIIATGGTITTSGNDKIHTFTGPGTFTVCAVANCAANNVVSHMVIAGGGGGAAGSGGEGGGGGGAGGFREVKSPTTPYTASPLDGYPSAPNRITVSATSFPITVGGGGAAGVYAPSPPASPEIGANGANSIFSTVTSAGGGGGGNGNSPPNPVTGGNGGSGGGGGSYGGSGGSGNTPPVTPSQGFNGGTGGAGAPGYASAGGGGATAQGVDGGPSASGAGGAGATSSINATPTARSGGGGGGAHPAGTGGAGGTGGGGAGSQTGTAGTVNTGGGGGGSGHTNSGGAGGSGIVIIRYKFQ